MVPAFRKLKSPVGELTLVASRDCLTAVLWEGGSPEHLGLPATDHWVLENAALQLEEYFDGKRKTFDLPLAFGGTDFQHRVWTELRGIPYGTTQSYGALARKIGKPSASRAVGAANGRNPLSIVIPCHRVVGANGQLTGFAGGLKAKAFLLGLEQRHKRG